MKILLLGSGGREDAFAWKLSQSDACKALFIAPGNAGTARYGINLPLSPNNFGAIKKAVLQHKVEMVICGPEDPLVNGLQNYFSNDPALAHILFFGPGQEAAQLEGSKAYAKKFMAEQSIPTAAYREFTVEQLAEGQAYIQTLTPPIVLKADGLAAGKGVLILDSNKAAKQAIKAMLEGQFGAASSKVIVEDFLEGMEFSVFVFTDGKSYKILPIAKDYKRIGEGDTGLNTGGMGSVSHPPFVDELMMQKVQERIIQPTIAGIQKRNLQYRGVIFIGLIAIKGDPFVIEYNCRMGDPETQSVFPRLKTDLVKLCEATAAGTLGDIDIDIREQTTASIILVAGGYPGTYKRNRPITGLEQVTDSIIFHAGTKRKGAELLTNGGRILAITSFGNTPEDAVNTSLTNAEKIKFEGKYYRRDIGFDL